MKEYQKINNIFKFDEKYRTIVGMTDTYQALRNIECHSIKCRRKNHKQFALDGTLEVEENE